MFFTQSLLRKKLTPAAMVITLALGMGLPLSASAEDTPQQPADQAPSGAPAAPAASEDGKVLLDIQEALNKNDFEKAVQLLTPLAEKKNGEACYVLGRLTAEGKGTKASRTRAAKLYETSAQQGDMRGQNAYGQALAMGDGIRRNFSEAAKWFGKAAEQGLATAQYNLGYLYDQGRGVAKSEDKAIELYSRAANQGLAAAQYSLGWIYMN